MRILDSMFHSASELRPLTCAPSCVFVLKTCTMVLTGLVTCLSVNTLWYSLLVNHVSIHLFMYYSYNNNNYHFDNFPYFPITIFLSLSYVIVMLTYF